MLRKLVLNNVGPAARLALDPVAPRVNLITGDNGLGKSFLLEVAWWALTRTWNEDPAVPTADAPSASIEYDFDGEKVPHRGNSPWVPGDQDWKRARGRPPNPGLVLYARVDGSFSVWDPERNYRLYKEKGQEVEFWPAFQFASTSEVLNGLKRTREGRIDEDTLCEGLYVHWRLWQGTGDARFELLKRLLAAIGPEGAPLEPGTPVAPFPLQDREFPTIRMPYGQDVPLAYAPAGVKRMCMLAYLLTWSFSEHERVAKLSQRPPARQIVVMLDEPETHLHPRWQRTVLPGLMKAVQAWRPEQPPEVQFLVATHSPLVLASMEPFFDRTKDALWKLDLVGQAVKIEADSWHKRGDVNMWLMSDVFDMETPYSTEAEHAMQAAEALMRRADVTEDEMKAVRGDLRGALADTDSFWLSWRAWVRQRGWMP